MMASPGMGRRGELINIIHFSDLHLGWESHGNTDPTTGLSTRFSDILSALDKVVGFALEKEADLVLFCGDAYKSRDPTQTQQREFARRISKLSQAGIPVFLLVGNHDLPGSFARATTIEIFDTLQVSNVHVAARAEVYHIQTRRGPVQIAALPWPRRSVLLAREETRDLSIQGINERLEAAMTQKLAELEEKLDSSLPAILAAHVAVSTAKTGSEHGMLVGSEPVLLLSNVARPAFDYVALGHIHQQQVLAEKPPVVYAGSLERLDFSDEDKEKGFYVVDIEPVGGRKKVDYHFHAIEARRFVTIDIDIADTDAAPMNTIVSRLGLEERRIADAIVRVNLSLPESLETVLNEAEIRRVLRPAHHVSLSPDVRRKARARLGMAGAERLSPLEALKVYLESKSTPEQHQKALLEYGERLIQENKT